MRTPPPGINVLLTVKTLPSLQCYIHVCSLEARTGRLPYSQPYHFQSRHPEPPTIELDFRDKIVIRVGESCLLQGRYTGKPSPSIVWYRDEDELKADKHVMFKNTLSTMSLGLMKAERQHSGRYVVVVENSTGSRKGVCMVTVVGR